MAKIDPLDDVGSLANTTSARAVINSNSQKIEDAFANTVSRDGSAPNQMEADFDLNDHYLLNVADPVNEADGVNLRSVRPLVEQFAAQIVETAVFGTQVVDSFTAMPGQTDFPLSESPGSIENVSLFIDELAKLPSTDFTLTGATLQTLVVTPALTGGETVLVRYTKALPSGVELAQNVTYTPPSTSIGTTVRGFLDALWSTGTDAGAKLLRWVQGGTGAVAQTVEDKLRRTIDAEDYGVTADGTTDDTAALVNAIARAKATSRRLRLPAGTIKTSAAVDISGVSIEGSSKGYRNANATIIEGNGTHDVLVQSTAGADETRMDLANLRIKGGLWGIKVRYMLHSRWSNVHVTDCATGGIQFGNSSDAGGLFNTFENVETDVTGTGIDINGNGFVNANSFNQCFFKGTQYGGRVRCNGGIGATDNVFNACEFLGDRYGVELENTSNTAFNQCYFESKGPSLLFVGTRNIAWSLNQCVYAVLENTNPTGRNAFVYHAGTGTCRGAIKGGYIYLDSSAVHNNLSFVASENVATFFLSMDQAPDRDIAATGFVLLNGLTSANLSITDTNTYTPTWAGSGSNPAIGDGTLVGRYARAGNEVTVTITMTAGSTTTFGSGDWTFSLPYPAAAQAAGSCYILDAGTGYFDGTALVGTNSSSVAIYRNGTATLVGAAVPMAWAQNDAITVTLTYIA